MQQIEPDFSKGNGLVPAVVQDAVNGTVLMLGFMNQEAFSRTRETNKVHFFSRSRDRLWMKGETSGNVLHLRSMRIDCDNDTLLIEAHPEGPTCHTGARTCFGESDGWAPQFLAQLEQVIVSRRRAGAEKSYVSSLFESGTKKIAQKVVEEAGEVAIEAVSGNRELFKEEAADLLFHYLVLLVDQGYSLGEIVSVLEKRHQKRATHGAE